MKNKPPYITDIPDELPEDAPDEIKELHHKLVLATDDNMRLADKANKRYGVTLPMTAISQARLQHLINFILGVDTRERLIFELAFAETVDTSLNEGMNSAAQQKQKIVQPKEKGLILP